MTNDVQRAHVSDAGFVMEDIAAFDDEALRTFLSPADGGIDTTVLGRACRSLDRALVQRIEASLPAAAARAFRAASTAAIGTRDVATAQRLVLERLRWPLVYWQRPDDYEELIAGERIPERVLDELGLDEAVVCDIGAGTGRFSLMAAQRARRVIAVDAVPALLRRLQQHASAARFDNIEIRRGSFAALPLEDASVDVAVACSSFTSTAPHGGDHALREAERIVRPGGCVGIIWPPDVSWLTTRGYAYIRIRGNDAVSFTDIDTARRLCEVYYGRGAAAWVRAHGTARVPYAVLGVSPPNDLCIKQITPSP